MIIPEILYRVPSGGRSVESFAQLKHFVLAKTDTNTDVSVEYENTLARYIILSHMLVVADPGAAQTVNVIWIAMRPPGATEEYYLKYNGVIGAAGVNAQLDWSGEILLPPTWLLRFRASFSAGAVGNYVSGYFQGIVIPVGSLLPT